MTDYLSAAFRPAIKDRFDAFKEKIATSSQSDALAVLLDIAERVEADSEDEASESVDGFLFSGESSVTFDYIHSGDSSISIIESIGDAEQYPISPVMVSNRTDAAIRCPVCESVVLSYEASDFVPVTNLNVFESMKARCPECGTPRDEFTLFAVPPEKETFNPPLYVQGTRVWRNWFSSSPYTDAEAVRRLRMYRQMQTEREGRGWLPDPSEWEFSYGNLSADMDNFVELVALYLRLLNQVHENTASVKIEEGRAWLPDGDAPYIWHQTDGAGCDLSEPHIHVAVSDGGYHGLREFTQDISEHWEGSARLEAHDDTATVYDLDVGVEEFVVSLPSVDF